MRVAFVQSLMFEYLGTMSLAAVLKQAGHQVEVFIDRRADPDRLVTEVETWRPHMVAFSCTTDNHVWALAVARRFRRRRPTIRTVFGGPHPTFWPQMVEEPEVDFVCRGEGEGALVELTDALAGGTSPAGIANLWGTWNGVPFRNDVRPLIEDLDGLPFPDRTLYRRRYPGLGRAQAVIMTGRGCPFACTFCFNHALQKVYAGKGRYVRRRSPANVLAEIDHCRATHPIRTVYFQDDTFLLDPRWVRTFLQGYAERVRLPFFCLATAEALTDEMVARLAAAGCRRVFFGIESGNASIRRQLLRKPLSDEAIRAAAHRLHAAGLPFRTYNMMGLPGETLEQAWETVRLNAAIATDFPWVSLFQPYPGTELGEQTRKQGLLADGPEAAMARSFFRSSALHQPDRQALEVLQKLFVPAVWWPRLHPLLRRLTALPPNPLFDLVFLVTYAWNITRSECLTWRETLRLALGNLRTFFLRRGGDHP
jgi:anaerobic magnesium-protoporphyrin IX monomethyl ester cyclase